MSTNISYILDMEMVYSQKKSNRNVASTNIYFPNKRKTKVVECCVRKKGEKKKHF